jgi:hypothetical protein
MTKALISLFVNNNKSMSSNQRDKEATTRMKKPMDYKIKQLDLKRIRK